MTIEQLEAFYDEKLRQLEGLKERGDLTADWGECSLIHTREALRLVREVRYAAGEPQQAEMKA